MEIGITGYTGFIGSHLYNRLKSHPDFRCHVFDRKKYCLFDIKSMKSFVENKDVIIHLAGANRAPEEELLKVNVLGTLNLMEAIRKYSQTDTRIIFSSSLQVYGLRKNLEYLKESDELKPNNVYGLSKKFAEEIISKYYEWYGIKSLIFRISNVYGEGCKPYYNSVISTFIDLIFKKRKIIINGTGEQARDFIYISDVVDAFLKAIRHHFKGLEVINICTGKPITINKIVSILRDVTGIPFVVEYKKDVEQTNFLVGDPTKAENVLGFKAKVDIKEGLIRTIRKWGDLGGGS